MKVTKIIIGLFEIVFFTRYNTLYTTNVVLKQRIKFSSVSVIMLNDVPHLHKPTFEFYKWSEINSNVSTNFNAESLQILVISSSSNNNSFSSILPM